MARGQGTVFPDMTRDDGELGLGSKRSFPKSVPQLVFAHPMRGQKAAAAFGWQEGLLNTWDRLLGQRGLEATIKSNRKLKAHVASKKWVWVKKKGTHGTQNTRVPILKMVSIFF